MILCKEIGKHFPNKIFSIGRCFVFESINWIGSLISNGYWYYCSCEWCGPWASYYFTWWMLKWASFFFFLSKCVLLTGSQCLPLSLYFIISRANVYWSIELEGGGGYVIKFKSLSKAFRRGRFFKFFLNWKGKFLINCTLKFVLTKHRAITAQSIKNGKVFPYTVY